MFYRTIVVLAAFAVLGTPAHAQKRKALIDEYGAGQGYGMAGCGPGSVIFGEKKGMVQAVGAITNAIYSAQSYAISSGTSNCGSSSQQANSSRYIEVNKLALEKDMARGQGETLSALSEVMGCANSDFSDLMITKYRFSNKSAEMSSDDVQRIAGESCKI